MPTLTLKEMRVRLRRWNSKANRLRSRVRLLELRLAEMTWRLERAHEELYRYSNRKRKIDDS